MTEDNDNPPHSRLFVTGTFCADEDAFRKEFGKYGNIENIIFIKQKDTGKSKGITFVKFSKASDAAIAMEALNHNSVLDCFRPITVKIAQDKSSDGIAKRVINDDDRIMRLFIIVPPQEDEESCRAHFAQFGQIRKVTLIPDKHRRGSHPPRTFAFVKFYKASDAAKAFEECDSRYKAVFAKAQVENSNTDDKDGYGNRQQRSGGGRYADKDNNSNKRMRDSYDDGGGNYSHHKRGNNMNPNNNMQNNLNVNPLMLMMMNKMSNNPFFSQDMMGMSGMQFSGMSGGGGGELIVKTKIPMGVSNLAQLFNVVPGMESCVPDGRSNGTIFNVTYTTPRAASYALEKLQGFEYPPGMPLAIACNFATDNNNFMNPMMTNYMNQTDMYGSLPMMDGGNGDSMMVGNNNMMGNEGDNNNNNFMSNMNSMNNNNNNNNFMGNMNDNNNNNISSNTGNMSDLNQEEYCSVPLPPPQPMATKTNHTKERLWVMGYPKIPPIPALMDIFGRFGNLLAVIPSKDRNYCFVHYAEVPSARDAKATLDKAVICGMEMKVVVAEPQTTRATDDSAYHHLNLPPKNR